MILPSLKSIFMEMSLKEPKVDEQDVDQKELQMGIKKEMEHTNDPQVAKVITLHHLGDVPNYYSMLKKFEDELGIKDESSTNDISSSGQFSASI